MFQIGTFFFSRCMLKLKKFLKSEVKLQMHSFFAETLKKFAPKKNFLNKIWQKKFLFQELQSHAGKMERACRIQK